MICDRENEIDAFIPEEYWTMEASLNIKGEKKPLVANFMGTETEKLILRMQHRCRRFLMKSKTLVSV